MDARITKLISIFFFFIFRKPGLGSRSRSRIRKELPGYFQEGYFYKVQDC